MTAMSEPTAREFEALTQSMRDLGGSIDALRKEMSATYVRKDVLEPQLTEIRSDIKGHSDWLLWAQRIIIGAVVIALLSLVIVQRGGAG